MAVMVSCPVYAPATVIALGILMPQRVFLFCGVLVEVVFCTWIPKYTGLVEAVTAVAAA